MQFASWNKTPLFIGAALMALAGRAEAGTCSYDAGSNTANVTISGVSTLVVSTAGGIQLDRVSCGAASVYNTQTIAIVGSGGADRLTLDLGRGGFQPGVAPAAGDGDIAEIDFTVNLGAGTDTLVLSGGTSDDTLTLGTLGANLNADADRDLTYAGVEVFQLIGNAGDDTLSAAGGSGAGEPMTIAVTLSGLAGFDTLVGGSGGDTIDGGDDDDTMYGNNGNDAMLGNAGDDSMDGGAGNDSFNEGRIISGNDVIIGGTGRDLLNYSYRANDVSVILDGSCYSGDVFGEMDCVGTDVELVYGGAGSDYLVGNALANELYGYGGMDWIEGLGGNDIIYGGDSDDIISGGEGNDTIQGQAGMDCIDGDSGDDLLYGGDGDDMIEGGAGNDTFYCGTGSDHTDAIELRGLDCELRI
ncbi:hypothetical protein L6R52_13570 [Myxococcota bacterium]|nr:hypothetical protein [Myxococcota bacterium]